MAKYRITGPDGASYQITAPDDATPEQVQAYVQQNFAKPAAPAAAPAQPLPTAPTSAKGGTLGGLFMGAVRDPVDALAQMARRVVPDGIGNTVDDFGNKLADLGLPVARSKGVEGVDNIVKAANQEYDQSRKMAAGGNVSGLVTGQQPEPGFDWARLGGNIVSPANLAGGKFVQGAKSLGGLAARGGIVGALAGMLQPVTEDTENFAEQKGKQAAAGAIGGAVLTPAAQAVGSAVGKAGAAVSGRLQRGARQVAAKTAPPSQVDDLARKVLESQGMRLEDAPAAILESVKRQMQEALKVGQKLDPAVAFRRAEAEAVGLTNDAGLMAGQASRNPTQFANERNLRGVTIKTAQGETNPIAERLAAQNRALMANFDQVGAGDAIDATTAGQRIMEGLKQADAPVKHGVDALYESARGMSGGRAAPLERGVFSQTANAELDKGMWGAFLPAEVRTLLNQISEGKTPFDVDAAVQIDSLLSRAARKAERSGDDAAAAAVGIVRKALHETPLAGDDAAAGAARAAGDVVSDVPVLPGAAVDRSVPVQRAGNEVSFQILQPGQGGSGAAGAPPDTGAAARAAFDEARRAARARFGTIEETPALKAALDDAAPDRFVQTYILNGNARDLGALKKVLEKNPQAMAQARSQVAAHLKRAAFGENLSGDKTFSPERYAATLRAMGKQRLETFFSPQELVRLNLVAKVGSDINSQPAGSAVNNSNTGSAVLNLLAKISEMPLLRNVPGARGVANQIGEIKTEQQINRALSGQLPNPPAELPPEVLRLFRPLLPATAIGAGSLGGAAGQ